LRRFGRRKRFRPDADAPSIDDDEEAADAAEEDDEDTAAEAPNLLGAMIGGFGWFSLFSELEAVRLLDGGLRTANGLLVDSDNFGLANIDPPAA
jgi:hypothetical protein